MAQARRANNLLPPPTTSAQDAGLSDAEIAVYRINERTKCAVTKDGSANAKACAYFISNYLQIYEPRPDFGGPCFKPFVLWDFQIEYVERMEEAYLNGHGLVAKKCRDMGITLTTLAWLFWRWLFGENFEALIGSMREDDLERKPGGFTPLFNKLGYFLDRLPDWLKPVGFNPNTDQQGMLLTNPSNGCAIRGQTTTGNFSLGGRFGVVVIDEAAQIKSDLSGQAQATTSSVFQLSTVYGDNHFKTSCEKAEKLGYLVEYAWDLNPLHTANNNAWFEKMRREMQPHEFGRYVMMDFEARAEGKVYEDFDTVLISSAYDYNPDLMLTTTADYGYSDYTAILFIQVDLDTDDIFVIDEVFENNQAIKFFVPFWPGAKPVKPNPHIYTKEQMLTRQRHNSWKKPIRNFGDRSGKAHSQTDGETTWGILEKYGIKVVLDDKYYQDMDERVRITRETLSRLHVHPRCEQFIKSMRNYGYKKTTASNSADPKPNHDANSHMATAYEYWCISQRLLPKNYSPVYNGDPAKVGQPPKMVFSRENHWTMNGRKRVATGRR